MVDEDWAQQEAALSVCWWRKPSIEWEHSWTSAKLNDWNVIYGVICKSIFSLSVSAQCFQITFLQNHLRNHFNPMMTHLWHHSQVFNSYDAVLIRWQRWKHHRLHTHVQSADTVFASLSCLSSKMQTERTHHTADTRSQSTPVTPD